VKCFTSERWRQVRRRAAPAKSAPRHQRLVEMKGGGAGAWARKRLQMSPSTADLKNDVTGNGGDLRCCEDSVRRVDAQDVICPTDKRDAVQLHRLPRQEGTGLGDGVPARGLYQREVIPVRASEKHAVLRYDARRALARHPEKFALLGRKRVVPRWLGWNRHAAPGRDGEQLQVMLCGEYDRRTALGKRVTGGAFGAGDRLQGRVVRRDRASQYNAARIGEQRVAGEAKLLTQRDEGIRARPGYVTEPGNRGCADGVG
jgi:hypothetical protein